MSAVPAATKHKKNLGGGKGHKKTSGKESRGSRHNRETTSAYVEDVLAGEEMGADVSLGRVIKVFGGARMSILLSSGEEITAMMKGTLRCSKGAARHADNLTAVSAGSFVVVQCDEVVKQVIGVLDRYQVKAIKKHGFAATRSFFEDEGGVDDGFEWDLEVAKEDEEVDVDAI